MQRKVISSRLIIGGIILLIVAILAGVGIANLSRREVAGAPTPTAATSSGIYTAYETTVYKFDARTGALLWHYQTANRYSVFSTVPTVVGNSVYISTGNALYTLDATTGKARWQQHWGAYNNSSDAVPVVSGNIVYIVAIDGALHALDISTGKELWSKAVDLATYIVPGQSATKGLLYLLQGFSLHAIDARTGAELWQTSLLNASESTSSFQVTDAIVANNAIYASFSYYNGGGVFSAVDAKSGKPLWSMQLEKGYQFFHLLVNNALVYMVATPLTAGKSFYEVAYDTTTGAQHWTISTNSKILDEPALDNGLLYLNAQNGYTYAVDAQSGKKLWTYHAQGDVNLSTVNNGTLYVEVGDAHTQENKQRMADGQLAFTPHYIVALNQSGTEVRRYNMPQGLYPGLLVVGNGIIYLAGEATLNAGDFHVFSALKGSNGAQLWQQKIENLPSSGANTVVIP